MMVKRRKKEQASKQQLTQEEIQEQQQLLQSKIRQEIQQMKSKLAINKRPKPGKGNSKGNSPSKMKAKNKDGGFFRKHLEEKIRMQNVPADAEYDAYEDDEYEDDYDNEDRSIENSTTSSKKHVRSSIYKVIDCIILNDIPLLKLQLSKHQLEDIIRRRAVGPMVFKSPEKTILPVMETAQTHSAIIGDSQYKEVFAAKPDKGKDNKYNMKSNKPPRPNAKNANWRYLCTFIIFTVYTPTEVNFLNRAAETLQGKSMTTYLSKTIWLDRTKES